MQLFPAYKNNYIIFFSEKRKIKLVFRSNLLKNIIIIIITLIYNYESDS